MKRMSIGLAALSILLVCSLALADFEGTKWKVKVTPDDQAQTAGQKEFDETLVFKGSQFVAEKFNAKNGFKSVAYDEDSRRFGPATFTAETTSEKNGKAKWSGTMTASTIKGELKWTKADGTELDFTFEGERQQG